MSQASDQDPTRRLVAERLLEHRDTLIARIRAQLARTRAPSARADDVFSTTLRRTDALTAAGRVLDTISDAHLLALATAIARNAVRETRREIARDARRVDAAADARRIREESPSTPPEPDPAEERRVAQVLGALSPQDLSLLELRLRGLDWPVVAEQLGTTPAGAHRRYYRVMAALAAADPDRREA